VAIVGVDVRELGIVHQLVVVAGIGAVNGHLSYSQMRRGDHVLE